MKALRLKRLIPFLTATFFAAACVAPAQTPEAAPEPETVRQPVPYDGVVRLGAEEITFKAQLAPTMEFPGWVDSNSPSYWAGDQLVVFNSAFQPTRTTGSSLDTLGEPEQVVMLDRQRDGGWWIEAVWPDAETGILHGWYHLEPDDLPCLTAPFIGAAVSLDDGATWLDMGPVLDTSLDIDCSYDNGYFVGGHGDFSVVLDENAEHFYFLYSNYSGDSSEQGVAVARSAFEDRGLPGTVYKYAGGLWGEPGLGGKADAIFPSSTGWAGPFVEAYWGPSVHWNAYLNAYVMLLNHTQGFEWEQEGIYISFSRDLASWTDPRKLLDADTWYPQAVGLEPGGTDREGGRTVRVYVGGVSQVILEFDP